MYLTLTHTCIYIIIYTIVQSKMYHIDNQRNITLLLIKRVHTRAYLIHFGRIKTKISHMSKMFLSSSNKQQYFHMETV